jgi:hypothetical protein
MTFKAVQGKLLRAGPTLLMRAANLPQCSPLSLYHDKQVRLIFTMEGEIKIFYEHQKSNLITKRKGKISMETSQEESLKLKLCEGFVKIKL